jgi:hydrogenase/urease accessory protein HupE
VEISGRMLALDERLEKEVGAVLCGGLGLAKGLVVAWES